MTLPVECRQAECGAVLHQALARWLYRSTGKLNGRSGTGSSVVRGLRRSAHPSGLAAANLLACGVSG